jgi:lambda repressor-like predicted transcriptional regulator
MDDNGWRASAQQAAEAIERALGTADPEDVVADLSAAGRALDEATREAMAAAVLDGTSMRRVAEVAGLAPNSVPPRLARSKSLGPYADEGAVSAQGIAVARYEAAARAGRPPLKFTPRRKESNDQS